MTDDPHKGQRIAEAMADAFISSGKLEVNTLRVARLDSRGAVTL